MIGFVEGELITRAPTQVVISCSGVGYELAIPLSTFDTLPAPGKRCRILTRLVVRDDAHLLFGFGSEDERGLFDLLCSVSRIGPKLALSVLSGLRTTEIRRAIATADAGMLSAVPGVGKRTAERICLELKDKVDVSYVSAEIGRSDATSGGIINEAVAALQVLGYSRTEAQDAVARVSKKKTDATTTEDLVRHALGSVAG